MGDSDSSTAIEQKYGFTPKYSLVGLVYCVFTGSCIALNLVYDSSMFLYFTNIILVFFLAAFAISRGILMTSITNMKSISFLKHDFGMYLVLCLILFILYHVILITLVENIWPGTLDRVTQLTTITKVVISIMICSYFLVVFATLFMIANIASAYLELTSKAIILDQVSTKVMPTQTTLSIINTALGDEHRL